MVQRTIRRRRSPGQSPMLALQERGCHNVNLVSPSHLGPQLVETLIRATRKLKSGQLDHKIEGLTDEFGELGGQAVVDVHQRMDLGQRIAFDQPAQQGL